MKKKIIHTKYAPDAVGPYSQGVRLGRRLFTAGQIGLDPTSGKMVEDNIKIQTEQALRNIEAILDKANTNLENVVKTTVYLADMDDFAAMNEVYAQFFRENPPARTTIQVAALPLGARVEIEAIAYVPKKK